MVKDYFEICDIEHDGDIEYFESIILGAGGIITVHSWIGNDGDCCYMFYRCSSREELEKVKSAMEEFL